MFIVVLQNSFLMLLLMMMVVVGPDYHEMVPNEPRKQKYFISHNVLHD
jgi:hypothetical protein